MEIHDHFITASNWHNKIPSRAARQQLLDLIAFIVGYPCELTCVPYEIRNKITILVVKQGQEYVTDWFDMDIEGYITVRKDQYPAQRFKGSKGIPATQARVDAYNETLTVLQYSDSE